MEQPATPAEHRLIDSGGGQVLESLGTLLATRPLPQAWWRRRLPGAEWRKGQDLRRKLPQPVPIRIGDLRFELHAQGGIRALAPELRGHWDEVTALCRDFASRHRRPARVLNLFGGAGGFTLAAARAGATVVHVDADGEAVQRAQRNDFLNPLPSRSIRWVSDQPAAYVKRERQQQARHDLIIIDPAQQPRDKGRNGFLLERDLHPLLAQVSGLLSNQPLGVLVFCRQGHVFPTTLRHLLQQEFGVFGGAVETGEIVLRGAEGVLPVPCGTFGQWILAIGF